MAARLMNQFKVTAAETFSSNRTRCSLFGRSFDIVHQHDNEFAVMANGVEIVRIIGNVHSFSVVEV